MNHDYPRDLAKKVHLHLIGNKQDDPPLAVLEELFETLFFASLQREETQTPKCRIVYLDRDNPDPNPPSRIVASRWKSYALSEPVAFTVSNLVKISAAVDPWVSTLAIDADKHGGLWIWGLIDQSVHYNAFIVREGESGHPMPGHFQAVIQGVGEITAYSSFVFLGSLRQNVLIRRQQGVFQSGPIHSALRQGITPLQASVRRAVGEEVYDERLHWDDSLESQWIAALCRVLMGIQRYGHGGALLLSDDIADLNVKFSLEYVRLKEALFTYAQKLIEVTQIRDDIHYKHLEFDNASSISVDLYLHEHVLAGEVDDISEEIRGCIKFVSSLSRVDGLIWMNSDLTLMGFGVEITCKNNPRTITRALSAAANDTELADISHFGTRHRSMMRYCAAHPSSIGFVVSQDGDIRAIMNVNGQVIIWENVRLQFLRNAGGKDAPR